MSYSLEVMNPVAAPAVAMHRLADRAGSLDGKVLGLFWNSKAGGEVVLEHLARRIQEEYRDVRVEWFANHYPAPAETVEAAARCDTVIGTTGD